MRNIKFSTVYKTTYISICLFLFMSCGTAKFDIPNFDQEAWLKNKTIDTENCITYRAQNYKTLVDNQDLLIKKTEVEITQFLGNPTKKEIGKHMKKALFYCLTGCNDCDNEGKFKKYLVVDFETFRKAKLLRIVIEN